MYQKFVTRKMARGKAPAKVKRANARTPGGVSRPRTFGTRIHARGEPASGKTRSRGWKLQGRGRAAARTARPSSSTSGLGQPHPKEP